MKRNNYSLNKTVERNSDSKYDYRLCWLKKFEELNMGQWTVFDTQELLIGIGILVLNTELFFMDY